MRPIVIYGAGGFGREVAWLIENINAKTNTWQLLGFIDDNAQLSGTTIDGFHVLGGKDWFDGYSQELHVVCAVGSSNVRRAICTELAQRRNVRLAKLIDPSASVARTAQIGEGSIICCACRLMVQASIGKGVVINTGSSVGHDGKLSDYTTLFTNVIVSGGARIGANSEIGSGAFILPCKSVGSDCVIAPLASVLTDLVEPGIYAGNPARRMR